MMLKRVKWNNVITPGFQGKNPCPGEIYYSLQGFFCPVSNKFTNIHL